MAKEILVGFSCEHYFTDDQSTEEIVEEYKKILLEKVEELTADNLIIPGR